MRILHTADWHVGKRLGRIDRRVEYEQVLDEVVAIARDQKVDLAIVAGDILDRAMPTFDAMHLALDGLVRLADAAGQVVAICGNHDSADLLSIFRPLLAGRGITLVPRILRPDQGGVVRVPSRDGSEAASVASLPFLHQAEVVDFMAESAEWFKEYPDRIRLLCRALVEACDPATVTVLTGHFFIDGSELGGGERLIHIGREYAATAQAIPPGAQYVALGHVHKPQAVKGAAVPARYAGSLLQLDFSERAHKKEVVIVDAKPGAAAKLTTIPLTSGRQLMRIEGALEDLKERVDEFGDAYLDVRVNTSGPVLGLAEQVRDFLPNAVLVQAIYERITTDLAVDTRADRPLSEVYAEFYASPRGHGVDAPAEVIEAFRSLEKDFEDATA